MLMTCPITDESNAERKFNVWLQQGWCWAQLSCSFEIVYNPVYRCFTNNKQIFDIIICIIRTQYSVTPTSLYQHCQVSGAGEVLGCQGWKVGKVRSQMHCWWPGHLAGGWGGGGSWWQESAGMEGSQVSDQPETRGWAGAGLPDSAASDCPAPTPRSHWSSPAPASAPVWSRHCCPGSGTSSPRSGRRLSSREPRLEEQRLLFPREVLPEDADTLDLARLWALLPENND